MASCLLKRLTRKIKLRNVIRRFVVSNITIKNENRYVSGLKNCRNQFECLVYEILFIRHLNVSDTLFAPHPRKFSVTFLFNFFWELQPSQEKLETMLMQNFA